MPIVAIPAIREFYMDLDTVLDISSDGPSKSFAFRRLQYLEGRWNLYVLLNEHQEMADSKVSVFNSPKFTERPGLISMSSML
jgi:AMP deaminase